MVFQFLFFDIMECNRLISVVILPLPNHLMPNVCSQLQNQQIVEMVIYRLFSCRKAFMYNNNNIVVTSQNVF